MLRMNPLDVKSSPEWQKTGIKERSQMMGVKNMYLVAFKQSLQPAIELYEIKYLIYYPA